MSTFKTTYDPGLGGGALADDHARALLARVMGYVAVTVGFTALGAYLGRRSQRRDGTGACSSVRSQPSSDQRRRDERP
jgi:hypothetical protein